MQPAVVIDLQLGEEVGSWIEHNMIAVCHSTVEAVLDDSALLPLALADDGPFGPYPILANEIRVARTHYYN